MPADNKVYVNGINGVTGEYLLPPMSLDEVAALAGGEKSPPGILSWLSKVWHKISTPHLGLPLGVDPADVTQAGWGIVFLKDEDPAVIAALQPLIEHRRKQIKNEALVKVLEYRAGQEWQDWLDGTGVAAGSVMPTKVPDSLLLGLKTFQPVVRVLEATTPSRLNVNDILAHGPVVRIDHAGENIRHRLIQGPRLV